MVSPSFISALMVSHSLSGKLSWPNMKVACLQKKQAPRALNAKIVDHAEIVDNAEIVDRARIAVNVKIAVNAVNDKIVVIVKIVVTVNKGGTTVALAIVVDVVVGAMVEMKVHKVMIDMTQMRTNQLAMIR
jgi:hypothetical protein